MNFGKESIRKKQKELSSKKEKVGKKFFTLFCQLAIVAVFALAVCLGCAGYGIYNGILASSPSIEDIDATPTGYLSTILDAEGNITATLVASGSNRVYVTLDEIPKDMQNAVIAVEDARFWTHKGIDLKGIVRAGVVGVTSGFHFSEGASTITQQLLKNNVFTGWMAEKSQISRFKRKIQEQNLALELEKKESKEWILENYLNTVNLGQNTLGVQSASRRYFGKDVSELTLSECAVIAGITKNPTAYNPIRYPKNNAERRKKVLGDMKEQNLISQEQYDAAMADPVYGRIRDVNAKQVEKPSIHSYFDDAVTAQVLKDLMDRLGYSQAEAYKALYNSGLTIYSTQDPKIQKICDEEMNNPENYPANPKVSFTYALTVKKKNGDMRYYDEQTMLAYYQAFNKDYSINFSSEQEAAKAIEQYKRDVMEQGDEIPKDGETVEYTLQPQAALTIIDVKSGKIKALAGGRGEKTANRSANRATDYMRQPGSTFEILAAYAPALDAGGMTLASVEDDAPYTFSDGTPLKNQDARYRGFTTVREAIRDSINVVAVKTLTDIGIDTGYQYLTQRFGFTTLTDEDRNEALALGGITEGVSNSELTAAYAMIANKGMSIEPRLYTKILAHDGSVLIDNEPQKTRVLEQSTAWLLTRAMQDAMKNGTGQEARFEKMALAGNMGTTTKNKDVLFAGFSPYYSCAVWGGYDDGTGQDSGGISYAGRIWRAVMSRVHKNKKNEKFSMPDDIVTAEVCKKSGLLVKSGVCENDPRGNMAVTEYFAAGTVPTEMCDRHERESVCMESGMRATAYCPEELIFSKIRIAGGSQNTEDAAYLSADGMSEDCNVHTSEPVAEPDTGTDDGENTLTDDGENTLTDDGGNTETDDSADTSDLSDPGGQEAAE